MSAKIACPAWCQSTHVNDSSDPESIPAHHKSFGDPKGANVEAWVAFYADGSIEDSGFIYSIEESETPEDMDEVAGWCTAAAAFMREIRGSLVTA